MEPDYDLVCIGAGPAGEKAAALAAYHGQTVAIVDDADRPGGTMVRGVATTKTMREAAIYLTSFRRREVYGVGLHLEPELAVQGVRERAARVQSRLAQTVQENLDRHGIALVRGTGRIAGADTVEVTTPGSADSQTLMCRVILIATGARPFHPPGIPFDHPDVLDSDMAGRLDRPVASLVVIGGGAVACEFASIFAALGSEVTLIESRGRLLPFVDHRAAELLTDAFVDMGVHVVLGGGHPQVTGDNDGANVQLPDGTWLHPSKVIVAAGRSGNTEDLGLAEAGIATDERGLIVVDERYQTTLAGVFAAGDVIGPPALASVSMQQGRVAACYAFGIPLLDMVDGLPPCGVYSIPEVGSVGLTEEAARAKSDDVEVGAARLSVNARTAINGGHAGLIKLVFRRSDHRLLGAHIVGDSASELIHYAQAVMQFGGTIDHFINTTFNVPTESEAFKYAAYDGLSRLENRETLTTSV